MEKSYLNIFKEIAFLYFEYCNKLDEYLKDNNSTLEAKEDKKSIFKKSSKTTISDYNIGTEINKIYAYINNIRNTMKSDDRDSFYRIVYDFTYFLKVIEKCFFYPNDDSCTIWSQVDDEKQLYILNIETDDYEVSYTFQNSVINVPGKSKNSLLDFMDDEDDKFNTIVFTTIDIVNNNQNHMKNQFKFVIGSIIEMEDDTDEMLYNVITSNTAEIIIDTLFDILDNRVRTQSRLKENLNVEDLINNGALDIWRR